jgi:hypothetical protein
MYKAEVEKARGIMDLIDRRLWQPLCLSLEECSAPRGPLKPMPQLFASACLPANLMSSSGKTLIRELFWGDLELISLPIGTVRQGSIAYSRFGRERYGWAVEGPTLYACLPYTEDTDKPLSALAVLLPDMDTIVENPDAGIPWLQEWNADLRAAALELAGLTEQSAPDAVNNGADRQTDKR